MLRFTAVLLLMLVGTIQVFCIPMPEVNSVEMVAPQEVHDASDSDIQEAQMEQDLALVCPREETLNVTSCMPENTDEVVYCIDETIDRCLCPIDTFCHYVGMARCLFICMDNAKEGSKNQDEDKFNDLAIKGPTNL